MFKWKGKKESVKPKNGRRGRYGSEEEKMDTAEQGGRHPDRTRRGTDPECFDSGHQGFSHQHYDGAQTQQQHQLQRSMEASKQMLYGVFGNVITILEEYEQRELAKHRMTLTMPKSDVYIPEQGHKTFEDIESIVETQLILFETQAKACPPEAKSEILEELKRRTISWSAVREEMGIQEIQQTDKYIAKLYEILAKGKTDHKPVGREEVSEEVMKEGFQAILYGEHDRATLDKEFRTNPDKKANAPKTRSSEQIDVGATRILRAREDKTLDSYLKEDVRALEQNGPEDLK